MFSIGVKRTTFKMGPSNTVLPVNKGHSREPENMSFIYRFKLYVLFINGET